MEECFRCGAEGDKTRLFDAISSEGIVKICADCSKGEDIPLINKPTSEQLKSAEQMKSYSQRVQEHLKTPTKEVVAPQDVSLKDIVDKNYQKQAGLEKKPRPDLVEHFHWVIMRARRAKKITIPQLAKELAEPETAIKMAEQGVLPENDNQLISKLEGFLGINLRKKKDDSFSFTVEGKEFVEERVEEKKELSLDFDSVTTKNLTISDLQELKKKKEEEILYGEEKKEEKKDEDLSDDDIDSLIFRK